MLLIPCPFCGPRDHAEFTYLGDGTVRRPPPGPDGAADRDAMAAYVYRRDNPKGAHRELWIHSLGCRSVVEVARDTFTHEIAEATLARGDAGGIA